ncbi:MAG: hypothetical protein ACOCTG_05385 [Bacteroidota bacterium]
MEAEDLAARLRGEVGPSRAMEIGTAWHAVLEDPPSLEIEEIESLGHRFRVECDATLELSPIRELRAEHVYEVDGVSVTLTGAVDGLAGTVITDHKLTSRIDPERYFGSYQWRAYLDIFGADAMDYRLFEAKDETDVIRITDMQTIRLYRYPGMREDLIAGIRDYLDFVRQYMPEHLEQKEAA